ncbi:ANTAR domain-containing protein [Arthrobacter sp. L77]|uniref:ANTAR domain-containing protein n=1 Tax=Arthrobacter sp. L77 TaxID=1496689 RepID=UPI0018CD6AF4|nr:ANTAR domain-containing protein [Arthrobacter sp. L77]
MNIRDDRMSLEHILQRLRELNETLSEQADSAQRRNVIGHATGILMERYAIGAEEAHALLVTTSNRSHSTLGHVAATLVTSGQLRGLDGRRTGPAG